MQDEELARQWQAGSTEAFARLVERFHRRLFNFLHHAAGSHHDAEDLTQETFLEAHRSIARYHVGRGFAPWLFGIARHALARHWRRRGRSVALPADFEERPAPESDPAQATAAADDGQALWDRARRLKPRQYQALWLRYAEGFQIATIAQIMGITQIHAKVLLFRGRAELARRLGVLVKTSGERHL